MTPKEKFLLGGVGALIPILSTVAIADADKIAEYIDHEILRLVGYVIRVVALFLVGAIWVYVDGSIVTRRKAIEVGIAAPALVSAWISTANVAHERDDAPGRAQAFTIELVSSAHAQDRQIGPGPQEPSPLQQLIKGILGR